MLEIRAVDHIDPDGRIVKSGELLAERAIEALTAGQDVRIRLQGMSGISSSYFNIFLRILQERCGSQALERVGMDFVSPIQKQVYDHSLKAITRVPVTH